ncbi:MAG: BamA/TamA family outer membrane protein [Bacteroidota bacterium]
MTQLRIFLILGLSGLFFACSSYKPYYHKTVKGWDQARLPEGLPTHTVFLLGDAGAPDTERQEPTLKLLQGQLEAAGENSSLIYLGDNVYPIGLVNKKHPERAQAEKMLTEQLDILANFKGRAFMLPGNHDWAKGGKKGYKYALNQEKFAEKYANKGNLFLPDDGCPGPVAVDLSPDLLLVIFNSQWWVHKHERPEGDESDCDVKSEAELIDHMKDIIAANPDRKIVVAAHHPLYSHGTHGGRFTVGDYFFPLREVNESLYIPLPVVGALYPLYRTILGDVQDIPHPKNQQLRKELMEIFRTHPNLVYTNGHEHALEYSTKDSIHFVVSGAGCKVTPVGKSRVARYTDPTHGFARLDYYEDGSAWLSYYSPIEDGSKGRLTFRKKLFEQPMAQPDLTQKQLAEKYADLNFADSTVSLKASQQYEAGKFKRFILGDNYRDAWSAPISVPVFDIGKEHGGLQILKRGGGQQTKSLRMQASDGKQYVLRTIEKYAAGAVPSFIRSTFAAALVQDQISSSHPFGAFVVPPLADAAEVCHANPQLVYVPEDPRLGEYADDFANSLCLYEERPANNWEDAQHFGSSKKIVNTAKVLDKIQDDNDNFVDQQWVLKSRLFDLFLGDWDRHDDQWRWASYDNGKGKIYRPIPRDRDQAFFKSQGPIMWLVTRKWAMPKFQAFGPELKNPPGHAFNARYFDRSFLTDKSWDEWERTVDSLQQRLSDGIIDNAIKNWPESVYAQTGASTAANLKARRDSLKNFAKELYLFLAKEVSVVGSDKHEIFEITYLPMEKVRVQMYKSDSEGNKKQMLYDRTFLASETKELRLYGRDGKDRFKFSGEGTSKIKIRLIGGDGEDRVSNEASSSKILLYDTKDGVEITGTGLRKKLSKDPEVNEYDRKSFQYDLLAPAAFFGFNIDDGIFIGGGLLSQTHGFRKDPFASTQSVLGNFAINSNSWNFKYRGNFTEVVGKWNYLLRLDANVPRFNNTFFGLGNETQIQDRDDLSFHWVNTRTVTFATGLQRRIGSAVKVEILPMAQWLQIDPDRNQGRFIDQITDAPGDEFFADLYEEKAFAGAQAAVELKSVDNAIYPTRGVYLKVNGSQLMGLNDRSGDVGQLNGEAGFYLTLNPVSTTIAARVGGGQVFGDWQFFQAPSIGMNAGLRGFRNNRFTGEQMAFFNVELRTRLAYLKSYFIPGSFGTVFFYDGGRVWQEGENSDVLHSGYGFGLWHSPFDKVVISATYGLSDESREEGNFSGLVFITFGFSF